MRCARISRQAGLHAFGDSFPVRAEKQALVFVLMFQPVKIAIEDAAGAQVANLEAR